MARPLSSTMQAALAACPSEWTRCTVAGVTHATIGALERRELIETRLWRNPVSGKLALGLYPSGWEWRRTRLGEDVALDALMEAER